MVRVPSRALVLAAVVTAVLGRRPAAAAIITVTTNADSGAGSLRAAITSANLTQAIDEIRFNLPAGSTKITPLTPLPALSTGIDVNGTSQPGYAGTPIVELDGSTAGGTGLYMSANLCVVRGLSIHGFATGIVLGGNLEVVKSNYIGTNPAGAAGLGNTGTGIDVAGTLSTIGGTAAADRNVISGNAGTGMVIETSASSDLIYGNYFGTNPAGTAALGNASYAIRSFGDGNAIGAELAGAGNLISGNGRSISLESANTTGTTVRGNVIGLNAAGTAALANHGGGIEINSSDNLIGGTTALARNVISGNDYDGIAVSSGADNVIAGNYIGTNAAGTAAIGNASSGIRILAATNTTVGGTAAGAGNVISGNSRGITVDNGGHTVQGNFIGTNAAGTAAIANTEDGLLIGGAANHIGGTAAGAGNLISGNGDGVIVSGGDGNVFEGNRMGTNAAGTAAVANGSYAIRVIGATGTMIGGAAAGAGNVISGNGRSIAFDDDAPGNVVQGNIIGLAADGTAPLGNASSGLEIASANNLVGGDSPGAGNVIASNQLYGIILEGGAATGNAIEGNKIGTAADGVTLRGNYYGILFYGASGNTIGGTTPGAGNVVAGSVNGGVYVWFGTHDAILGNATFANGGLGIDLDPQGITGNDAGDVDAGANQTQNMPVLTSALTGGGQLALHGSLASMPLTPYRIEFFSSPSCDPSGFGEGRTFLGSTIAFTDAGGTAAIAASVPFASADPAITATATSPQGDTSELSPCATVAAGQNPGVLQFATAQFLGYEEAGATTITVTRSGGASGAVTVHYATADDTAVAPGDYGATSGTLAFADGEVVKTFDVPLVLDGPDGGAESIKLALSAPTGGATLGATAASHILLFDYDKSFPGVYISDATVTEGDAGTVDADFTVTLTPTDHVVSFTVRTFAGTATAGIDYDEQIVDLSFNPGDAPKVVSVPVHGDTGVEGDEIFFMQVSGPIQPNGYAGNVGHGVIVDDDGPSGPPPACIGGVGAAKPRLLVGNFNGKSGDDKLGLRAALTFPAPLSPALDPVAKGFRVRAEDAAAQLLFDTYVPPGAYDALTKTGWSLNKSGTSWTFKSRTPVGGVVTGVKLQAVAKTPGLVKVAVNGRKGTWAGAPPTLPLTATVVIDAPVAAFGQCGTLTFPGPTPVCAFDKKGTSVKCK